MVQHRTRAGEALNETARHRFRRQGDTGSHSQREDHQWRRSHQDTGQPDETRGSMNESSAAFSWTQRRRQARRWRSTTKASCRNGRRLASRSRVERGIRRDSHRREINERERLETEDAERGRHKKRSAKRVRRSTAAGTTRVSACAPRAITKQQHMSKISVPTAANVSRVANERRSHTVRSTSPTRPRRSGTSTPVQARPSPSAPAADAATFDEADIVEPWRNDALQAIPRLARATLGASSNAIAAASATKGWREKG